ncbi:hypothetical protein CHF27_008765 [Romboutsia maritimum]|uniref:J domain-containing protein n=1 Tax=Romboutsia maritimum TaxID=2020948 RepID=A0A371IS59_9FIRM|nr:DnaJ domain-containing protein [Romboutsia maritimum]RDY23328.1 hypothetical protein CHF27_008765 [Romboutsia maritimum]
MDDILKNIGLICVIGIVIFLGVTVVIPIVLPIVFILGLVFLVGVGIGIKDEIKNKKFGHYNNHNSKANCICPYCKVSYNADDGFYVCDCGKKFRKVGNEIYKEEDTVDDIMQDFVKLTAYISKADGVVTKNEVESLRSILKNDFELSSSKIMWCANVFNETKQYNYDNKIVKELNDIIDTLCDGDVDIKKTILYNCIKISKVDGEQSSKQKSILEDIMYIFRISRTEYERFNSSFEYEKSQSKSLDEYYKILDVDTDVTLEELKKAYKKLMKKYHPDLHQSKGLSDEEMKKIHEKTIEIKEAYEFLKEKLDS